LISCWRFVFRRAVLGLGAVFEQLVARELPALRGVRAPRKILLAASESALTSPRPSVL
jgi:hypothetical protein